MSEINLPKPPISADIYVPGSYPYFWVNTDKLKNSLFWNTASLAARGAAVDLWMTAFHESPAGSLPNDDTFLAAIVGLGRDKLAVRRWLKIKEQAMHGFTLCRDNRWYHPEIIESALYALEDLQKEEVPASTTPP